MKNSVLDSVRMADDDEKMNDLFGSDDDEAEEAGAVEVPTRGEENLEDDMEDDMEAGAPPRPQERDDQDEQEDEEGGVDPNERCAFMSEHDMHCQRSEYPCN